MIALLKRLHQEESGQDIIEYVLIGGLVSLAAIGIMPTLAATLLTKWTALNTALNLT